MAGVRRLGASRASIVSSAEPALTAAFAFAAFGDRFGAVQLAGVGLVLASIPILEVKRTRSKSHRRASRPGAARSPHSLHDRHSEKGTTDGHPQCHQTLSGRPHAQPAGPPVGQQRPPVDIDAAYGTLSISEPTLAVGRAYGSGGSLASGAALQSVRRRRLAPATLQCLPRWRCWRSRDRRKGLRRLLRRRRRSRVSWSRVRTLPTANTRGMLV